MLDPIPVLKGILFIGLGLACVFLLYFKLAEREADRRRAQRLAAQSKRKHRLTGVDQGSRQANHGTRTR